MRWLLVAALSFTACSNRASHPRPEAEQSAGAGTAGAADFTTPHADGDPQPDADRPTRTGQAEATRFGKPIGIHLRSQPPGAETAVDGVVLGRTPAYWSGSADGREHEFAFTLAGHQIARYRFVPVASGVIHAKLVPIDEQASDGGIGAASGR